MKGKKLSAEELCRVYNSLQQTYGVNKTPISFERMKSIMKSNKISAPLFQYLRTHGSYFGETKKGRKVTLYFSSCPIHLEVIRRTLDGYYSKTKEEVFNFSVEDAIRMLKSKGYRILKEKGLDTDKLQKEMPEVYEKFLVTEEI